MSGTPLPLALVGIGKIARDQHLPAIGREPAFALVAAASRDGKVEGIANYPDLDALLTDQPDIAAVSIATPPRGRHRLAAAAIAAGKHVMIEKPPGATVREVEALVRAADEAGVTLFTAWHSREAPGVAPAREWLAGKAIRSVAVTWKEDIRHWHPGQDWILEPGGLGVFDPGINALSILTAILPEPFTLEEAELGFPANRDTPLTAELHFALGQGGRMTASFSFLQNGPQSWDIAIETGSGALTLGAGGHELTIDGRAVAAASGGEYPRLYAEFAALIAAGRCDVDLAPLQIVADAFMIGRRREIAPFDW